MQNQEIEKDLRSSCQRRDECDDLEVFENGQKWSTQ